MMRAVGSYLAGLVLALGLGWTALPRLLYREARQPAAFNHKAHTVKGGMACADCHGFRDDGKFAGIPKLESCAGCHAEPLGETAGEKHFVAEFVKKNREPEWLVYSRQPDNAWFPHSVHVTRGKLTCERCHGGHGKSAALPAYRVNRISGYPEGVMGKPAGRFGLRRAGGMRMDDCVACHREHALSHSCLDCHK